MATIFPFVKIFFKIAIVCMVVAVYLLSCDKKNTGRQGVAAAMKQYDNFLLKMNADSTALLFTTDGKLGEMATGRDSIKTFLRSFSNVRVLYQRSASDSINITGDTAVQKGSYRQIDLVNTRDTVKVAGNFTVKWIWLQDSGWHIKQITTISK